MIWSYIFDGVYPMVYYKRSSDFLLLKFYSYIKLIFMFYLQHFVFLMYYGFFNFFIEIITKYYLNEYLASFFIVAL